MLSADKLRRGQKLEWVTHLGRRVFLSISKRIGVWETSLKTLTGARWTVCFDMVKPRSSGGQTGPAGSPGEVSDQHQSWSGVINPATRGSVMDNTQRDVGSNPTAPTGA